MWFISSFNVLALDKQPPHIIRYPIIVGSPLYQYQSNYFIEILQLALNKSGLNYKIEFIDILNVPQSRSQFLINQGMYDVHWLTATIERESQLKPIRIPLFKGLLGLRISFVRQKKQDLFAKTNTLKQLSQFFAGQGRDWLDSKVLKHHNLNLIEANTTTALLAMLNIDRIDYVPRSVIEIWSEAKLPGMEKFSIDPYIALYYPEMVYFFVRNEDTVLYEHIAKGLNIAIDDGSFQEIFDLYFGDSIEKAQFDKRKIFSLTNPFLSPKTPLSDSRLWHELPALKNANSGP